MLGQPIWNKFLEKNYLFALRHTGGFLFGRVIDRRICQYKPWKLIDSAGTAVDIGATTYKGEYRFRDQRNTEVDILYLDSATDAGYAWFLHGAIGIKPQYVRMYLRIPEGKDIPGKFPNLDPIKPKSGDDVGYVTSDESPYEMPTDFAELVIPPLTHIGAEYYNMHTSNAYQPTLNLLFVVYWVELFDRDRPAHRELIASIASRKIPTSYLTVGMPGLPIEVPGRVLKEWTIESLTLDEASTLR